MVCRPQCERDTVIGGEEPKRTDHQGQRGDLSRANRPET